ncbi:hypothetical protein [Novosphingobium kaempferiae]|uniref:hypothetical protein n=1 Tax=Novosphingobium kaempferiae TaxID=2896849 RepID=UPI001E45629F|nr:hypothetical protein [Novosphingobium kaempferiae]
MTNDASRARDLLRIALELLEDDESLVAAAMISGAINVLEGNTSPAVAESGIHLKQFARPRLVTPDYRSCA